MSKLELFYEVTEDRMKLYCRKNLGTGDEFLHPIGGCYHVGDDVEESVETILKRMDYDTLDYVVTELVVGRRSEGELKK